MQEYAKTQEISSFTLYFTSKILENIINLQSRQSEPDKSVKKQEHFVVFPFSISLESSKSSSKLQTNFPNGFKKRQIITKNHTFSLGGIRKNTGDQMSNFFFKTTDDIQPPDDLTKKMLHQMEHDINYSKLLQKEDHTQNSTEEAYPTYSTVNTEAHQKQALEEKNHSSGSSPNQINYEGMEKKLFESIDNEDKKMCDSIDNDDKEILDLLTNECPNKEKTISKSEIDDEEIPGEFKAFKNVPGLTPSQQRGKFSDLDNSNITFIEETSFFKFGEKTAKMNQIFDKNLVREGWLLRKTRNFISGWESVWIFLTQEKLQYFSDQSKTKLKGGINFRLSKCSVTLKDCIVTIKIIGYNKFLKLKYCSKTMAREWAKLIDDIIFNNQSENKLSIRHENLDKYMNDDFMSEEEFQLICETGDILLFETRNFPAKFQRSLTGSKYDHVALAMKFGDETWVFDAQSDKGVSLLKWAEFIDINDLFTKVVYRKLIMPNKEMLEGKLFMFIANNVGKKYELTLRKILFRKRSEIKLKDPKSPQNSSKSGYFCSELIAAAYKELGLLDQTLSASQYWPGNFSSEKNLKLLLGATLSEEITVVMDRDLL